MTFTGTLLPWQKEDFPKVLHRLENGGAVLAYEQGLGKTVMSIAILEHLMSTEVVDEPGLIICPASLRQQWVNAIHQFTGGTWDVESKSYIPGTSHAITLADCPHPLLLTSSDDPLYDYLVLSYEQVVRLWGDVKHLARGFVVLDEITAIKHFASKRTKHITKYLSSPVRIGLTGTPMDNGRLEELYCLMRWIDPDVLGAWQIFDPTFIIRNQFGAPVKYRNLPAFWKALDGVMFRRTSAEPLVVKHMPERIELPHVLVELDPAGRELYEKIEDELLDLLDEASAQGIEVSLESIYTGRGAYATELTGKIGQRRLALLMLCSHPLLLHESASRWNDQMAGKTHSGGSAYIASLVKLGMLDGVTAAPKYNAVLDHAVELARAGNKLVIFTTYKATQNMLHVDLKRLGIEAMLFGGRVSTPKGKESSLAAFRFGEASILISTDAGGYGLDLPEANWILNLDQPEKSGAADQRNTRHKRASSVHKRVYVQTYIVANTIEQHRASVIDRKRAVADAFMDQRGVTAHGHLVLPTTSLRRSINASSQT